MMEFKNHCIQPKEKYPVYPFRKLLGLLMYLASTTRLDISFSVGYLSRRQINPQPIDHKLMSHLLAYLANHKKMSLIYKRNKDSKNAIELFADADYATDKSRASTSGFLLRYHGSTIHWASRLQSSIAESSAEAELRSLTEGVRDALFLVRLQEDLLRQSDLPIIGYEDNQATYHQCVGNASASRLKHIETIFFKVNEYVQKGLIRLVLVGSLQQLADIILKSTM